MASKSLAVWRGDSAKELDEIVAAHKAIGGAGRGRRYATVQINHAYAVMLSSQFQRFCRNLHTEAADHAVGSITNLRLRWICVARFAENRKLDTGNPNPGNLGTDFGRFDFPFWPAIIAFNARNVDRRSRLEELNAWRNAIAHQHFDPAKLGGRIRLTLADVKNWRASCNGLAVSFDEVMRVHLQLLLGMSPW